MPNVPEYSLYDVLRDVRRRTPQPVSQRTGFSTMIVRSCSSVIPRSRAVPRLDRPKPDQSTGYTAWRSIEHGRELAHAQTLCPSLEQLRYLRRRPTHAVARRHRDRSSGRRPQARRLLCGTTGQGDDLPDQNSGIVPTRALDRGLGGAKRKGTQILTRSTIGSARRACRRPDSEAAQAVRQHGHRRGRLEVPERVDNLIGQSGDFPAFVGGVLRGAAASRAAA